MVRPPVFLLLCLFAMVLCGCSSHKTPTSRPVLGDANLQKPIVIDSVRSECVPPNGWTIEKEERKEFARQTWIAPSGRTAYGVIRYDLPLPVGNDWALVGFVEGLKQSEGSSAVVEKKPLTDGSLSALVDAGDYRMRCVVRTYGMGAWVVYASTMKSAPIIEEELKLAELAREQTDVDVETAKH